MHEPTITATELETNNGGTVWIVGYDLPFIGIIEMIPVRRWKGVEVLTRYMVTHANWNYALMWGMFPTPYQPTGRHGIW